MDFISLVFNVTQTNCRASVYHCVVLLIRPGEGKWECSVQCSWGIRVKNQGSENFARIVWNRQSQYLSDSQISLYRTVIGRVKLCEPRISDPVQNCGSVRFDIL